LLHRLSNVFNPKASSDNRSAKTRILIKRLAGIEEAIMRAFIIALAILCSIGFAQTARAQDRTFGGFDCTVDCSGHSAGYKWAEKKGIDDETDCPDGNSQSFHEGCVAYTQDNARDPDADDDENMVGQPSKRSKDSDDDDEDEDDK
jgi:hypothetical protein